MTEPVAFMITFADGQRWFSEKPPRAVDIHGRPAEVRSLVLQTELEALQDMLGRAEWWLSTFPAGAVMRAEIRKLLGWPPVEEPTGGHHQQREEKQ